MDAVYAKGRRGFIPDEIYNKRVRPNMVISCGDAIVITYNGILLGKRLNPPMQGEYWFPGGRLHKGEGLEESIIKNVKSETGLAVEVVKGMFPVIGDTIFAVGEDRHSLNTTLIVRHVGGVPDLRKDIEAPRFINSIEADLHPYVKEILRRSGVFHPDVKEVLWSGGSEVLQNHQIPGIVRYDETDPKVALMQIARLRESYPDAAQHELDRLKIASELRE